MPFPDVETELDYFERGDANPVDGDWGYPVRSSLNKPHQLVSTYLTDTARSKHETYFTGITVSGQMQVQILAEDRNIQGLGIVVVSSVEGLADGIVAIQEGSSSGAVYDLTNNTLTSLSTWSGVAFNNNDWLGVEFDDTGATIAVTVHADEGSGWTEYDTVSSANHVGNTFYFWVTSTSATGLLIALDDLRGGEVSAGAVYQDVTLISRAHTLYSPTALVDAQQDVTLLNRTYTLYSPTALVDAQQDLPLISRAITLFDPTALVDAQQDVSLIEWGFTIFEVTTATTPTEFLSLILRTYIVNPIATLTNTADRELIEALLGVGEGQMSASYQVTIYDASTGAALAVLDTSVMQRLRYKRTLNAPGQLQLTIPVGHSAAQYLRLPENTDQIIEVTRWPTPGTKQVEGTYLLRQVQRFMDETAFIWLVIGGVSLEDLLLRRVINPADDPLEAGGYSTKSGPVDMVMAELVEEQAGPSASTGRQTTGLTVETPAGVGNEVGGRWRFENLHEELLKLANASGMDFRIERTAGASFTFMAEVVGADKSYSTNYPLAATVITFAPELGTMAEPEYTVDRRQEFTYAYLLGNGPGEDREVYENSSVRASDSPWNRRELAEDAHMDDDEGESPVQFLTKAAALLAEHEPERTFEFDLPASQYAYYRTRFDLGDLVTARWVDVAAEVRIIGVEVSIQREESIKLELEIRRWLT